MKLCYVLLLSLAAVVSADYYEQQQQQQEEASSPSNYYGQRPARRRQTGLAGFVKGLLDGDDNRRQFTGTGTATGGGAFGGLPVTGGGGGFNLRAILPFLFPFAMLIFGAGVLIVAFSLLNFNSSGRGLDTDEWEVDHSVWMNQLQKDFEDSWATE